MDHDIVQNSGRRQHQPPVKGQRASGAAASPAGLLVADGDAAVGAAGELLEVGGSFRKVFSGSGDIALCQGGTLGVGQIGDRHPGLFLLLFQIFCDDPVLPVCQKMAYFPVADE